MSSRSWPPLRFPSVTAWASAPVPGIDPVDGAARDWIPAIDAYGEILAAEYGEAPKAKKTAASVKEEAKLTTFFPGGVATIGKDLWEWATVIASKAAATTTELPAATTVQIQCDA